MFLAVNAGTGEPVVFTYLDLFRGLTASTQHWGAGAGLPCREMGLLRRASGFSLVQLGGHSALGLSLIFHDPINEAAALEDVGTVSQG